MNPFNKKLIECMERDSRATTFDFNLEYASVNHQDGSSFHVNFAKLEKTNVNGLPCIIIFGEHISPQIFVEYDLERVVTRERGGSPITYGLATPPNQTPAKSEPKKASKGKKPAKKVKKEVKKKKVVKKTKKTSKKLLLG